MSLIPNIQLFATDPNAGLNKESITNAGEEQGFLIRCTDEVYKIMKKNNQIIPDNLYFVSYGSPSSSNLTATTCLYMGDKLVGNSGVLFIEATNGFARIKGNKINLTTPTALTSALHGNPGQVVFVVNHTVDESTNTDQYNTFMYLWKSIKDNNNASNVDDGEWINANLNYTLTGIDNLGNADLEFTESLSTTPNENTLYILDSDTKIPDDMKVTDRAMYVYDAASSVWVAISGGVGRNSDYAQDAHTFNNYVDNLAKAKGANAFNEQTVASARFSNSFGYKSESNDLAGMTGGIKNINSGAAGIVVGTNNEVGQYFTYCYTFYNDDKPRVFISSATGNVIAPNFDIGGKLIFTNRNHLVKTTSDYCCTITDYSHNDNCLFVDHIPSALFNWFDELTTEDGSSTNRYRVKENTLVKFIQEDSTAGASVSSTATDLDNIGDDYLGGANNVVGGHHNDVHGANDAVVGNNLKTKEDNVALFGEFNKETDEATVMSLGNGTDEDHRSNAMVVYKSGTAELSGGTGNKSTSVATRGFVTDILTDANYMGVLIYGAGKSDERGSAITSGLNRLIVDTLPTDSIDTNTIYMLRKSEPDDNDSYDEYMYINSQWEIIGNTKVDLSNYVTRAEYSGLNIAINNMKSSMLTREVVYSLPSEGLSNVIYMLRRTDTSASNIYDEYMFVAREYTVGRFNRIVVAQNTINNVVHGRTLIDNAKLVSLTESGQYTTALFTYKVNSQGSENILRVRMLTNTSSSTNVPQFLSILRNDYSQSTLSYQYQFTVTNTYLDQVSISNLVYEPEKIGSTEVDLSNYVTKDSYDSLLSRVENLEYEPIKITSFTSKHSGYYEVGYVLSRVDLNWSTSKTPSKIIAAGREITNMNQTALIISDANLSGSAYMTLQVTDERGATDSKTVNFYFCYRLYWGTGSSLDITNLSYNELSGDVSRTITLTTGENEYMYYAIPKVLGTAQFKVGGFDGGFDDPIEQTITNSYGLEVDYLIYKSTNSNLGTQTVVVSKGV